MYLRKNALELLKPLVPISWLEDVLETGAKMYVRNHTHLQLSVTSPVFPLLIHLSQLGFYCCNKTPSWEEKGLFGLHFLIAVHH